LNKIAWFVAEQLVKKWKHDGETNKQDPIEWPGRRNTQQEKEHKEQERRGAGYLETKHDASTPSLYSKCSVPGYIVSSESAEC